MMRHGELTRKIWVLALTGAVLIGSAACGGRSSLSTRAGGADATETWWRDLGLADREEYVRGAIMAHLVEYASSKGYTFGGGTAGPIDSGAARAATDIVSRTVFLREVEAQMMPVLRSGESLVDRLIAASMIIPGYEQSHNGVLGEQTWGAAASAFCPVYPWC